MYSLLDLNNFYVSCERLFNPGLEGKPVIVLSNNDGCTISRSEEAKALGIKMGTPEFLIRGMIKRHDIKVFSSNYTLYQDISNRVMATLQTFVPRMEVYSIDEAFLDMSELEHEDLLALGIRITRTLKQHIGMPACIGIASTKALAKMANCYVKKKRKEPGVYCLANKQLVSEALQSTEVGDIWGIGRQYASLLKGHGYHTAADLVKANDEWIRKNMSVVGQRLVSELRGQPCMKWEYEPQRKKNICTARSFGQLISEKGPIQEAVSNYTVMCAQKLREERSLACKLLVFVETNVHRVEDRQYRNTITMELPVPTNSTSELIRYALECMDRIYKSGYNYNKAGVIVMNLVPDEQIQLSLFQSKDFEKDKRIHQVLDRINGAMGRDTVRYAVQGYEKKYKLRAQYLSPCYTTRMSDLITIKY